MANQKVIAKRGMRGHNASRWAKRHVVKAAAKKARRREAKLRVLEEEPGKR